MEGMPTPEQLAAQKEALEFQMEAARAELAIRRANIIINALAVGGDVVKPLFEDEDRAELEGKLSEILKEV